MKRERRFQRGILLVAVIAGLILMLACAGAAAESGTCGPNLTWELDANGVLTISGTGAMSSYEKSPWPAVKQAVIQSGVTTVGKRAFYNCKDLTNVSLPGSVTKIGEESFSDCKKLMQITIPAGVTGIGGYAFSKCESLTAVTIPGSVTEIGSHAFSKCKNLTGIVLPSGLLKLGNYAFYQCENLLSVSIPGGVAEIGSSAFAGCSKLQSASIENGVTEIGTKTFMDCVSLTGMTIPDSVKKIRDYAFNRCTGLASVSLPADLKTLSFGIFANCTALKAVTIPKKVKTIEGSAFYGCTALATLAVPASVASIGDYVFHNCGSLNSITIPVCNSFAIQWFQSNGYAAAVTVGPHEEIVTDAAVEPTCTEPGLTAGSHCAACNTVIEAQTSIPALGHDWQAPTYVWAADYHAVTATRICARNAEHVETETVNTRAEVTRQPTMDQMGEHTYTAEFRNSAFATQSRVVRDIPRLGNIPMKKCTVSGIRDLEYTGAALKQNLSVRYKKEHLTEGQDYTVSYRNNRRIGTATVILTGQGDFTGTVEKTFRIRPQAVALRSVTAKKKALTVKWKSSSGITGYQLAYSASKDFADDTILTLEGSGTTKKTITGLKSGKTYYVRIRAWKTVNGKKYYSAWSEAVKKKTK